MVLSQRYFAKGHSSHSIFAGWSSINGPDLIFLGSVHRMGIKGLCCNRCMFKILGRWGRGKSPSSQGLQRSWRLCLAFTDSLLRFQKQVTDLLRAWIIPQSGCLKRGEESLKDDVNSWHLIYSPYSFTSKLKQSILNYIRKTTIFCVFLFMYAQLWRLRWHLRTHCEQSSFQKNILFSSWIFVSSRKNLK